MKMIRFKWSSVRVGVVVSIAVLVSACGKSPPPPATSSAPSVSVVATPAPEPPSEEAEPAARSRPRVLLWVEGGSDENTIWRGWPAFVRVQTLAGDPPGDVQLRGPSVVALASGKGVGVWVVSAAQSAALAPGAYTLFAGDQLSAIVVEDAPRELSSELQALRQRRLVQAAVALGDTAAAAQAADAWVQAAPASFEARVAQGDARRALGDSSGALAAYNEALARVPRGIDPPPANVHAKITEALKERAASLAKKTSAAPTADETKHHELIDAGDKALAADDRASASLRYAEADAFRRERALAVSSIELDDKRAAIGAASATPASARTAAVSTGSAAQPGAPAAGTIVPAAELDEAKILADANGQWAASAAAGSQYSSPNYSAAKMVGAPDVPKAGDSVNAWCHGSGSKPDEWIELTFAKPVRATEVRVRQNNAPGAIVKVGAFEQDGTAHIWWAGADPFKAPSQATLAWFAVRVPRTDYLVAKIKITLNLAAVPGWKEIDAVQLVGTAP